MKRLLMAVFVVLLSSAVACASGFSVSGGVNFGKYKDGPDDYYRTAEDTGYYISGSGSLPGFPLSFTGSYSSFTSEEYELYDDGSATTSSFEETTSLLKVMVGYQMPVFPVAVGAGYVSQNQSGEGDWNMSASGVAVGAYGTFAISEQADIAAEFYYVPSATIDEAGTESEGSGWAFEVKGSYLVTSQLGVEAGYRSTCFEADEGEDYEGAFKVGGFFLGLKYSF